MGAAVSEYQVTIVNLWYYRHIWMHKSIYRMLTIRMPLLQCLKKMGPSSFQPITQIWVNYLFGFSFLNFILWKCVRSTFWHSFGNGFINNRSGISGSRHSSYTSHQSRISYTSHGDLLGTKEQKLRHRSRNQSVVMQQPGADINHKGHRDFVSFFFIQFWFIFLFLISPNKMQISMNLSYNRIMGRTTLTRLVK